MRSAKDRPQTRVKKPEPTVGTDAWLIWAAWADRITFEEIKEKTGLTESNVIKKCSGCSHPKISGAGVSVPIPSASSTVVNFSYRATTRTAGTRNKSKHRYSTTFSRTRSSPCPLTFWIENLWRPISRPSSVSTNTRQRPDW